MPANLTTLAHFSVSSAISLPKSVGEPGSTGEPNSANRALSLGAANPALISLLSLSMITTGVFLGTPTPYHALVFVARHEVANRRQVRQRRSSSGGKQAVLVGWRLGAERQWQESRGRRERGHNKVILMWKWY